MPLLILAFAALASTAAAQSPAVASAPAQLLQRANVEAAAGHPGQAILNYERAKWLAPHDEAVNKQLAATRTQAGIAVPQETTIARAAHCLTFDALTALASLSLILFSFLVLGTRLIPTTLRRLARSVATAAGVVAVLAAFGVGARWPELHRAVVVTSTASARIAPANSAAISFTPKEGDVVLVKKTYGQFVQVHTDDGRTGWLPSTQVENIIPATS